MLMVGVFGPKYPCEEVFIKHIGNNQYNVQYVSDDWIFCFDFSFVVFFFLLDCTREGRIHVDCEMGRSTHPGFSLAHRSRLGEERHVKNANERASNNTNTTKFSSYLYAYMLENFSFYIFSFALWWNSLSLSLIE